MITVELTEKIEALSYDEYCMAETYVDNVLEYSKRRKKWHGKRLSQIWNSQRREWERKVVLVPDNSEKI